MFIIGTRNGMKRGIREIYEKKRLVKKYIDYSVNENEVHGVFSSWEIALDVMTKMEDDNIELSNDIMCEVMNAAYECGKL